MDKYSAIMAAADFIERNPQRYNYYNVRAPEKCNDGGGDGCMIGWIGTFVGLEGRNVCDVMKHLTGVHEHMPKRAFPINEAEEERFPEWRFNAKHAANVMRQFAQQFKPIEATPPLAKLDPAFLSFRDKLSVWKPVAIAASFLLCLLLASTANAGTTFSYYAATDGSYQCPTYCSGFATSDPAHTVGYVNVQFYGLLWDGTQYKQTFRFVLNVDGVDYRAYAADSPFTATATDGSGKTIVATVNYTSTRTCNHSGRGQTCVTRYFTQSGTVALQ